MDTNANEWYRRAQLAIQSGNDALAKEALVRRQLALDEVNNMIQQINIQNNALEKLYDSMVLLEKKIIESQSKKDQMIARAQTARAATKVNDMLSGLTGSTSMDAFKRMEEKVESLEAKAEISMDMIRIMELPSSMSSVSSKSLLSSNSIERQFQLLEAQSSVDEELAKLKTQLLMGSRTTTTTIPELTQSLSSTIGSSSSKAAEAVPVTTKTTTTTRVTTTTMEDPIFT
jgi:phage shock protein A